MASTSISCPFPWSWCSSSATISRRRLYNSRFTYSSRINPNLLPLTTTVGSSKPGLEEQQLDSRSDEPNFSSQEDLMYLGKLGGGSIVGAVAIKYGSILLPEITRPNIVLALFMIFAPCLIAVLLLVRQSQIEERDGNGDEKEEEEEDIIT